MSKLLIEEPPLQVLPSLAKAIGINEAIILQQIHYWISQKKHLYDNKYWTYNTYSEWQKQLPYLTERGIRSIIKKLENMGLVESNNYNRNAFNHTKWYTVNYRLLESYQPLVPTDVELSDGSEPSLSDATITETTETSNIYIGEFKNVHLREADLQTLNNRYGEDLTNRCIDDLSAYFKKDPKKALQDHYSTLHKWVIKAVLQSNPPRVLTQSQMAECEKKWSPIRSKYNYDQGSQKFRLK